MYSFIKIKQCELQLFLLIGNYILFFCIKVILYLTLYKYYNYLILYILYFLIK